MKKSIKYIIAAIVTILILFTQNNTAAAQYYRCKWESTYGTGACIIDREYCTPECGVPDNSCAVLSREACDENQACDCPGVGYYRCGWGGLFCDVVDDSCAGGCYVPSGACQLLETESSCNEGGAYASCVCPAGNECEEDHKGKCVPDGYVCDSTVWWQSDCIEGEKCVIETAICVTPTPGGEPFPTQAFKQCGDKYCNNEEFPFGSCLDYKPGDICERPSDDDGVGLDEDGSVDCSINGEDFDCWCCQEYLAPYTEREEMSPLCGSTSVNTAIGCIPVGDKNAFLAFILKWAIGISGGVSFILIVYSGITIMTAGGDKRKLQAGKELLTAALMGLILIIFSVFILDLIGIRILKLPGM